MSVDDRTPESDQTPTNEHMIPKHRFDEVLQKSKEYESKVAEMVAEVEALKNENTKIAELTAEIEKIKADHESQKVMEAKVSVIEGKVKDRVVDFELFLTLIDLEKVEVDADGKIKGLDSQVKELQKSKPYLWKKSRQVVDPGAGSKNSTEKTFAQQLAERKKAQRAITAKGKNYFN